MKSVLFFSALMFSGALLAGCSGMDQPVGSNADAAPAPEYRTGSNIPIKEHRPSSATATSAASAPVKN